MRPDLELRDAIGMVVAGAEEDHVVICTVLQLFPLTKAGAVVGWIYDPKEPMGDNFVDFGIYEVCREKAVDFVNGYERSFILDFNVVGDITDALATHQTL